MNKTACSADDLKKPQLEVIKMQNEVKFAQINAATKILEVTMQTVKYKDAKEVADAWKQFYAAVRQ